MRATFGDYRDKMSAHPLPALSGPSVSRRQEPEGVFYRVSGSKARKDTPDPPCPTFSFEFDTTDTCNR